MKIIVTVLALVSLSTLTGCATILSGSSQTITLQTNPDGARCELQREGRIIGAVESTPGAVTIKKTKHDIDVICVKPGFSQSKEFAKSGVEGAVFGNILLGGFIGWAVDSAAGTDNKYPDVITINLASGADSTNNTSPPLASKPAAPIAAHERSNETKRKLKMLDKLKADGDVSEQEYQTKRAQILDAI